MTYLKTIKMRKKGRPLKNDSVKINTEITLKQNKIVVSYQNIKSDLIREKVSKPDAINDIIEMGCVEAELKIIQMQQEINENEIKRLNDQIKTLENER